MKRLQVAVIGFGRLGRACAQTVLASDDAELAGIARRPEHVLTPTAVDLGDVPVVAHWTEIREMDLALLCLPQDLIVPMAHELLQHRKPIVDAHNCTATRSSSIGTKFTRSPFESTRPPSWEQAGIQAHYRSFATSSGCWPRKAIQRRQIAPALACITAHGCAA